jgi:hypothetical protein
MDYLLMNEVIEILKVSIERIRICIKDGKLPVYVCTHNNLFYDFCVLKGCSGQLGKYCKAKLPIESISNHFKFSGFDMFDKKGNYIGVERGGLSLCLETYEYIRFKKEDVLRLKLEIEQECEMFSLNHEKPGNNMQVAIAASGCKSISDCVDHYRKQNMKDEQIVYELMKNHGKSGKYSIPNDMKLSALEIGINVLSTSEYKTKHQKDALESKVWRIMKKYTAKKVTL